MDGTKRTTDDAERPTGGESSNEETPWQTGIRRRRRNNSTSSNSQEQRQQSTHATPPNLRQNGENNNANSTQSNFSNAGFGINDGGGAAISVGGPCGGGVAVGHQSSAAFGMLGSGGGGTPSTPFKATSPTGKDLVPATPSSVTTAETAGSTLYTQTQSPLRVRRRQSSRRSLSSPSLRRQYQLLQSQTILLLGGSALGLLLFLFFALPMAAFISFALMIASIGALVPVASSAIRARYELEMEHPLGLLRYLPESLRVLLTETSIHQWMVEGTFVMEYRHLLLYLIPGLEEEQLMEFINRLPPRHRDVLLQPGLGRLIPPSTMRHFIRMDNDATSGDTTQLPQILENDETDNVSVASGLTHDHDDHISVIDEAVEEDDHRVTFIEAIRSLRETLSSAEPFSPNRSSPSPGLATPRVENVQSPPIVADTSPHDNAAEVYEQDDDNSSFDISLDLDMTDIIREPITTPVAAPSPTNVVVGISSPQPVGQVEQSQSNEQEEFEIEGRIISDAINAAVSNYSSQASAVVVESASEAVDGVSTWFIRAGTLTGFVAGGGGILTAMISSSPTSLSVTLGSMVNRFTSREVSSVETASNTSAVDRRNQTLSNQVVNGLLTTSFVGFASAGVSYLVRNRVRRAIAARRQERLESNSDKRDT